MTRVTAYGGFQLGVAQGCTTTPACQKLVMSWYVEIYDSTVYGADNDFEVPNSLIFFQNGTTIQGLGTRAFV
jgi:hypothetical protein